MMGILLATLFGPVSCAKSQQSTTATAETDGGEDGDTLQEEEAAMDDLDSYLEEEGEDADTKAGDGGGEDVGEEGDKPQSTPKERTDQIYALIKSKRTSVANCYKMAKEKDPSIGKKIAIRIVIQPDGSLKGDPVVEEERTDIANVDVRRCAIDVVKSVEYPPHPKGMETTFTYPFGF